LEPRRRQPAAAAAAAAAATAAALFIRTLIHAPGAVQVEVARLVHEDILVLIEVGATVALH